MSGTVAVSAGAVSMEGLSGTNPTAVFNTGSFTVNTYNVISSTPYTVDTSGTFSNPFQATIQTLTSISVSINTPATYSFTGLTDVQYDFTVAHQSTFPAGSIVTLTKPTSNCLDMYTTGGVNTTTITLSSAISSSLSSSTALTFSYSKFTNPRMTNLACGSFYILVTTSAGYNIESGTGGSVTVANANTLSTFQITATSPSSLINGGTSNYTISTTASSYTSLVSGDRYYITFPSAITVSGASCPSITCSFNAGDILITLTSAVTSTTALTFTLQDIVVQGDWEPVSTTISVKVVTSASTSQVISTHSTTTIPTTTVAGTLTSVSLSQSSNVASASATYTFTFTTANAIPVNGVVLIKNTPGLSFTTTSITGCSTASGSFGVCTYDSASNGVVVPVTTAIAKGISRTITIGTYTNPSVPTSSSFGIDTFKTSAMAYKIDTVSSGLVPSLECDYPCKTCTTGSRSTCTS